MDPWTHSPGGPIQNLGGMRLETIDGKPIPWRRDEAEVCRIQCTIPSGVEKIVVRLDYICNQPSVNSSGADSFGNTQLGVINWNTCLLYPENVSIDDLRVKARLLLPPKWRFGTALKATEETPGVLDFQPETLRDLVDSPLICGEYLRTLELKPKNFPPVFMHLVSESQEAVQLDEKLIEKYRNVAAEAGALFGGAAGCVAYLAPLCPLGPGGLGLVTGAKSIVFSGTPGKFVFDDLTFGAGNDPLPPPPFSSGTPEPTAWALMLLGFGAVGAALRRRKAASLQIFYGAG